MPLERRSARARTHVPSCRVDAQVLPGLLDAVCAVVALVALVAWMYAVHVLAVQPQNRSLWCALGLCV